MQRYHQVTAENGGEALSRGRSCRSFCGKVMETGWHSSSTRWRFVCSKAGTAHRWS